MSPSQTGDDPEKVRSWSEGGASFCAGGLSGRSGSTETGSPPHLGVVEEVVGASRILGELSRQRVIRDACKRLDEEDAGTQEQARALAQAGLAVAEREAEEYLARQIRSRVGEADGDFARVLLEAYPPDLVQPLGALLDAVTDLTTTQLMAMTVRAAEAVSKLGPAHFVTPYQRAVHGVLAAVLERRSDGAHVPPLPPVRWGGGGRG